MENWENKDYKFKTPCLELIYIFDKISGAGEQFPESRSQKVKNKYPGA